LNADGHYDLVVPQDPSKSTPQAFASSAGQPYWATYFGTAIGFGTGATAWAVPDVAFDAPGGGGWVTMDIDSDGRLDLVLTQDPTATTSQAFVAATGPYWVVFLGQASGFAATQTPWPVPDAAYFATSYAQGSIAWTTMDLDGDGHVDLVRTRDPNNPTQQAFGAPGQAYWELFPGTAKGFQSTPARWALPDVIYDGLSGATGTNDWATLDLDGDGHLDLVRTRDPATTSPPAAFGASGTAPYWELHAGVSGGFSPTPQQWHVPSAAFATISSAADPSFWSVLDLDGDRRLDLVQTRDPQASTSTPFVGNGIAYWSLYRGTSNGFSAAPAAFRVPDTSYFTLEKAVDPDVWTTIDLDVDGCVDLVRMRDPQASIPTTFAGPAWRVYRGQ
jgi:hypothetical protein